MRIDWQWWWRVGKIVLGLAIVVGIGWRFATILRRPELWEQPVHARVEWLEATALFYVLGLGFPALFWNWLVASVGERPRLLATIRAYYIGQLAKYIPGKAVGLLLRTGLLAESGIRPGIGAMTTTYETLTTMASGAIVAAVLLGALAAGREQARLGAVIMVLVAGLPTLPFIFNPLMKFIARLADRTAHRLGTTDEMAPLPAVRFRTLLGGLGLTAIGWGVLGLSLWAILQALLPVPLVWDAARWGRCTAYVAVSWVVGFISFFTPGGLGVREGILQPLLTLEILEDVPANEAEPRAVVIVLVLRLLWTFAEIMIAGIVYWLPATARPPTATPPAAEPPAPDPGLAS
jgi:glycosyltransferase 2 family protein